jgi:hypothetical protein
VDTRLEKEAEGGDEGEAKIGDSKTNVIPGAIRGYSTVTKEK